MPSSLRRLLTIGTLTFLPFASAVAQQPGSPPPVSVAKPVVRDVVDNDEFIGRFEPVDQVSVRSRIGGYLQEVHFTDGALVTQGDLLFVIDQRPFVTALNNRF
jgi:multidrug efflux system membrane fusion protein